MPIYKHIICGRSEEHAGEPMTCPEFGDCPNPDRGFDLVCGTHHIWRCKVCHQVFQSVTDPIRCVYEITGACGDPDNELWTLLCDCGE